MTQLAISKLNLREKITAGMESAHRSRERGGGDAILAGLADRVDASGARAMRAYDEFSTVEHTSGVVAADRRRGRVARALFALLEGWALFDEDPARQGAASRILQAVYPGTLAFLDAPYYEESLTLEKMLTGLAALATDVETVGVGPVVAALVAAQAGFVAQVQARSAAVAGRPETVATAARPFERDLRNLVQYLTTAYEGRDLEHALEPLVKLRRAPGADSPAAPPTPTV
jgi:hypothetical protein